MRGRFILSTKIGTFIFPYDGNVDSFFQISEQLEAICSGFTDL